MHVGSPGALYKQRWQQQQAIVVHVTAVSKDHGSVWKLGQGEGRMDGGLNMVIGEKGRQGYIALPSCPYQPLCFNTASMMN